jgi:hypothetical protein
MMVLDLSMRSDGGAIDPGLRKRRLQVAKIQRRPWAGRLRAAGLFALGGPHAFLHRSLQACETGASDHLGMSVALALIVEFGAYRGIWIGFARGSSAIIFALAGVIGPGCSILASGWRLPLQECSPFSRDVARVLGIDQLRTATCKPANADADNQTG